MELGEKLRLARQAAGLSQRQLCGEEITRNMLSQIEHGSARPSMKTLRYLAGRLGKPVSYFLEEDSLLLPNRNAMEAARQAFDRGEFAAALAALGNWQSPDPVFDRERQLLTGLSLLELAEEALLQQRYPYAGELLERAEEYSTDPGYPLRELENRRLLLLGKLPGENLQELCKKLPGLDEGLLLRAEAVLEEAPERAAEFLAAAEDRVSPRWNLLQGRLLLRKGQYGAAAACLEKAEAAFPREAVPMLEVCFREMGDFQKAYLYACKQR